MQPIRTIWTIYVGGYTGTIPAAFGQRFKRRSALKFPYIIQCKIVTPGRGQFWPQGHNLYNFGRGLSKELTDDARRATDDWRRTTMDDGQRPVTIAPPSTKCSGELINKGYLLVFVGYRFLAHEWSWKITSGAATSEKTFFYDHQWAKKLASYQMLTNFLFLCLKWIKIVSIISDFINSPLGAPIHSTN